MRPQSAVLNQSAILIGDLAAKTDGGLQTYATGGVGDGAAAGVGAGAGTALAAGTGSFSSFETLSEHFAPFDTQYVTRSRFSSSVAGFVRGLYVPTTSTGRPLRARSFSMTTTR